MDQIEPIEVANLCKAGVKGYNEMNGRIYDAGGAAPTIRANSGGHNEIKIAEPILITGKQAHQSIKTDGICNSLTAAMGMGGGYTPMVCIPQATKQGYINCEVGGVVDLSFPNSRTRRGRVQEGGSVSPTITAESNGLCRIEPRIGAIRGRNPDNPSDRTAGAPTQQRHEIGGECSNTLTTVQKDNVVIEPSVRVRKLTPLECWRLMGFDDGAFYRAHYGPEVPSDIAAKIERRAVTREEWKKLWPYMRRDYVSNSQLYKQAGNSIVVDVLMAIFAEMV